jgi:hypothetical protein
MGVSNSPDEAFTHAIPQERRAIRRSEGMTENTVDQLAAFLEEALAVRKGFFILWLRPQVLSLDTLQPEHA